MPLVRIVIPTFNRASLLAKALGSVLLQSCSDFEVLVIDDGSTDNTEDLLKQLSIRDSRIRYLTQSNCGAAVARNKAIREPGQHKYIAFLDSDDLWYPRHLEESVTTLERESEVALVFSRVKTIDLAGHWTAEGIRDREKRISSLLEYSTLLPMSNSYLLDPSKCFRAILRSEFVPHPSTVVIRRDAVSRLEWFNSSLEIVEDVEFFFHLAAKRLLFSFIDSIHAEVQYHGDNLTGSRDLSSVITLRRQRSVLQYSKMKVKLCSVSEDKDFVAHEIASALYLIAQCCAEQADLSSARRAYFEAFRYQASRRVLKGLISCLLPLSVYLFLKKQRDAFREILYRS